MSVLFLAKNVLLVTCLIRNGVLPSQVKTVSRSVSSVRVRGPVLVCKSTGFTAKAYEVNDSNALLKCPSVV
jgi:hypothetical protein